MMDCRLFIYPVYIVYIQISHQLCLVSLNRSTFLLEKLSRDLIKLLCYNRFSMNKLQYAIVIRGVPDISWRGKAKRSSHLCISCLPPYGCTDQSSVVAFYLHVLRRSTDGVEGFATCMTYVLSPVVSAQPPDAVPVRRFAWPLPTIFQERQPRSRARLS